MQIKRARMIIGRVRQILPQTRDARREEYGLREVRCAGFGGTANIHMQYQSRRIVHHITMIKMALEHMIIGLTNIDCD